MIFALLAALVAVNVAYLVLLDRKDGRDRVERANTLQRIQAPEAAVVQHQIENYGPAEAVYPLSERESAEREAMDQLHRQIADLEAAENGNR